MKNVVGRRSWEEELEEGGGGGVELGGVGGEERWGSRVGRRRRS